MSTVQTPAETEPETINPVHDHREDWAERPELNALLPGIGKGTEFDPEPKMHNIAGKRDYPEYERLYRGNTPRPFVCHVEDESLMLDFDKFHGKYKSIFYPKLGKAADKDD